MGDQDTLAQAKAAQALGDQFAPPVGSLVYSHLWETSVTVVGTMANCIGGYYFHVVLGDKRETAEVGVSQRAGLIVYLDEPFTVLEVPVGCLPFEDWIRPRAAADRLLTVIGND